MKEKTEEKRLRDINCMLQKFLAKQLGSKFMDCIEENYSIKLRKKRTFGPEIPLQERYIMGLDVEFANMLYNRAYELGISTNNALNDFIKESYFLLVNHPQRPRTVDNLSERYHRAFLDKKKRKRCMRGRFKK